MTAADRAAALLRQLDAKRQRDQDKSETTRVSCTEHGCRSQLICVTAHADNLTPTWRCMIHRDDHPTDTGETT